MLTSVAFALLLHAPVISREPDLVYATVEGVALKLDVYRGAAGKDALAMMAIHGGAWMGGDRKDMQVFAEAAAAKGFVVFAPQYRLAPKFKYPAMVDDVRAAVRFVRSQATRFGIDPTRIGAMGVSAGGHLSLLLGDEGPKLPKADPMGRYSSRVQAVLDMFGPKDMSMYGPQFDPVFLAVLGKKRTEASAESKAASPVTFVNRNSPPTFMIQGTNDPLVPKPQSDKYEGLLKSFGVKHEYIVIEGMGHGPDAKTMDAFKKAYAEGLNFVWDVLAKPKPYIEKPHAKMSIPR